MTIIIKAKRNGFRRCGVAHADRPTRYSDDHFTEEQLEALFKEPQLHVSHERDEPNAGLEQPDGTLPQTPPQTTSTLEAILPQSSETNSAPVGSNGNLHLDKVQSTTVDGQLNVLQLVADDAHWEAAHLEDRMREADKVWDDAHQEELEREAAKALAAKPVVKAEKPKPVKAKDESK